MSPRITDQEAWEAKRKHLLDAALKVFAAQGFVGTRLSDIAEASGMSAALLYHYFKDKEELFTELVRLASTSSLGSFSLACGLSERPAVKLFFLIDMIFSYAYQGEGPLWFLIMIQAGTFEPLPEGVKAITKEFTPRYQELLEPVIRQGQEAGELRSSDPAQLFHMVLALIQGYAVLSGYRDWAIQAPDAVFLSDLFLTPVGKQAVAEWRARGGTALELSAPSA